MTQQQTNFELQIKQQASAEVQAIENSPIVKYNTLHPKISELRTDDSQKRFMATMLSISKALGIANAPDVNHLKAVLKFLQNNFGDYTTGEFAYSFELYALQKLEVEKSKSHFHTFNFEFIAAVLYAYANYRRVTMEKYRKQKELAEVKEIPYEDYARTMHESAMEYLSMKREMMTAWDWQACYDHLVAIEEVKMTADDKKIYAELRRKDLLEEAEQNRVLGGDSEYKQAIKNANDKNYLAWYCRCTIAKEYYGTKLEIINYEYEIGKGKPNVTEIDDADADYESEGIDET